MYMQELLCANLPARLLPARLEPCANQTRLGHTYSIKALLRTAVCVKIC